MKQHRYLVKKNFDFNDTSLVYILKTNEKEFKVGNTTDFYKTRKPMYTCGQRTTDIEILRAYVGGKHLEDYLKNNMVDRIGNSESFSSERISINDFDRLVEDYYCLVDFYIYIQGNYAKISMIKNSAYPVKDVKEYIKKINSVLCKNFCIQIKELSTNNTNWFFEIESEWKYKHYKHERNHSNLKILDYYSKISGISFDKNSNKTFEQQIGGGQLSDLVDTAKKQGIIIPNDYCYNRATKYYYDELEKITIQMLNNGNKKLGYKKLLGLDTSRLNIIGKETYDHIINREWENIPTDEEEFLYVNI